LGGGFAVRRRRRGRAAGGAQGGGAVGVDGSWLADDLAGFGQVFLEAVGLADEVRETEGAGVAGLIPDTAL